MGKLQASVGEGGDCSGNGTVPALLSTPFQKPMDTTMTAEEVYLSEIDQIPRLTLQEEHDLTEMVRKGDDAARRKMITANLRLVVVIARQFRHRGVLMMDLIQEGNIGLMEAVRRYDTKHDAKFSTYAAWWIKCEIKRAILQQSKPVKLTTYAQDKLSLLRKASQRLVEKNGYTPNAAELAEATGMTVGRVERYLSLNRAPLSLDAPSFGADGRESEPYQLADESTLDIGALAESEERIQLMREMVCYLDERSGKILTMKYGLDGKRPLNREAIGKRMKLTRERVRQLENRALLQLRGWITMRMSHGKDTMLKMQVSDRVARAGAWGRSGTVLQSVAARAA